MEDVADALSPPSLVPNLAGFVVVVVGAGSVATGWSNGKASAACYARAGAAVVCADYRGERADETAGLISAEGGRACAVEADATVEADVERVMSLALQKYGRLDVVHNNVGIGGSVGTPEEIEPAAWDREISQNLTSAYLGIRCAVPYMREQGGGAIVNVSSLVSTRFLRQPNVAYTASKAAVEAMTRACAAAYGSDNIRVNCLRIGFSETPLLDVALSERQVTREQREIEMQKSRRKVPLRHEHTSPFDVAAAAVFLASPAARHITGAILNVDGGLECAPI